MNITKAQVPRITITLDIDEARALAAVCSQSSPVSALVVGATPSTKPNGEFLDAKRQQSIAIILSDLSNHFSYNDIP